MQLFRGESVATKLLYYYFYSTHGGLNYLRSLVLPLLNDFENSGFENANIATSDMDEDTMSKLLTISATFIRNIFSSLDRVPMYDDDLVGSGRVALLLIYHTLSLYTAHSECCFPTHKQSSQPSSLRCASW